MAILQVRDVPDDLYETLSNVAKQSHRSIAQETLVLLRQALQMEVSRKAKRSATLEKIEALSVVKLPHTATSMPSPEALIREDRDR